MTTGLILDTVATASSRNSSAPQRKKNDNSAYTFHNRSFGIGFTVGITGIGEKEAFIQPTRYNFTQDGYTSSVTCIRNTSSLLTIGDPLTAAAVGVIGFQAFALSGSLPNGLWSGYPAWGVTADTIVGVAALKGNGRYMYGIVDTNISVHPLDGIQCEAKFSATQFNVYVDTLQRDISVSRNGAIATDIEPSGVLALNAFMQLAFAGQTLTTLYTSLIGNAFNFNIDNVRARADHGNATEEDILVGVAEAMEAVLDFSFETFGLAQTELARDVRQVAAVAEIAVVRIGSPIYTYLSFAINLAIFIAIATEALRTRFWKKLPRINCLDTKSAIIASSAGTLKLGDVAHSWDGDEADNAIGRVKIILEQDRPFFIQANEFSERKYLLSN